MALNILFQQVAQDTTVTTDSTLVSNTPPNLLDSFASLELWKNMALVGGRIILILILAWFLIRAIDRLTRRWARRYDALPELNPTRQRAQTINTLFSSVARYLLWPLAVIMVLSEMKLDVSALLATAGIAGIAIGFGAQTLVQDVISGVFLLFDDTIHVGDNIRVGSEIGVVESIGVRLIKIRKFDGELLMVPAGELRTFGNKSMDFARVIVDVGLAYEQDIEKTLPIMQRIADEWAEENRHVLKEPAPQVQAITQLGESSMNARIIVKVIPGEQFEAERVIRRRLKQAFDAGGIDIPFPRSMVYFKQEELPGSTD